MKGGRHPDRKIARTGRLPVVPDDVAVSRTLGNPAPESLNVRDTFRDEDDDMIVFEELRRLALLGEESRFLAHEIGQWLNVTGFSIENLLLELARRAGEEGGKEARASSRPAAFAPIRPARRANTDPPGMDPPETDRFGPAFMPAPDRIGSGRVPEEDGTVIRRLTEAHASLQRALCLLHRMVRFGSADPSDAGKPFRLVKSVYNVTRLLTPGLRDRGILLSLRTSCPVDREIFGNVIEIEQVLANLIGNAREAFEAHSRGHGKPDRRPRRVRISLFDEPANGSVRLQVADTAGGISVDPPDKIFDPFVSSVKDGKGFGLGLAYCRRVVAAHGGSLSVRNVGKGASFDLRLPACQIRTPENGQPSEQTRKTGQAGKEPS